MPENMKSVIGSLFLIRIRSRKNLIRKKVDYLRLFAFTRILPHFKLYLIILITLNRNMQKQHMVAHRNKVSYSKKLKTNPFI